MPFAAVVIATVPASLAGWGLLALLERFTAEAATAWTAVALAVLALSTAPIFAPDLTPDAGITLSLLHLAVGAILIPAFRKDARRA
ncbi:DUF6069 family protein [Streptomyces sp. NPDC060194]|uniref:DUF6069 family protein n=1 Tax=Streptomyces sp. NPDC060194 TaxID=3347069 RepID=UPI0036658E93